MLCGVLARSSRRWVIPTMLDKWWLWFRIPVVPGSSNCCSFNFQKRWIQEVQSQMTYFRRYGNATEALWDKSTTYAFNLMWSLFPLLDGMRLSLRASWASGYFTFYCSICKVPSRIFNYHGESIRKFALVPSPPSPAQKAPSQSGIILWNHRQSLNSCLVCLGSSEIRR